MSMVSSLLGLLVGCGLFLVGQGLWRIFFHPLAKFPGPRLAALTYWYEFYYDVILGGQYVFHVKYLHSKYGPIIRINPHELHISDPTFYNTIYAGAGHKRDRDPWHSNGLVLPGSVGESPPHDLHRKRRAGLANYFSMASTRRMMPAVQERVDTLVDRFLDLRGSEEPVNFLHALSAFSNDVITKYIFGRLDHRTEADKFAPEWYLLEIEATRAVNTMRNISWIPTMLLYCPDWLGQYLGSGFKAVIDQKIILRKDIKTIKEHSSNAKAPRETVFHHILDSSLPESEKQDWRLVNEAILIIGAGSHTVAWALTVATYHILSTPSILKCLKDELVGAKQAKASGDNLTFLELEKLPYLTAVIKEGLRLSYGVSCRIPRIAPDETLHYKSWAIPPGTSMSTYAPIAHQDPTIFPNPEKFLPERWLDGKNVYLDKYMVAFSAGSRMCLGINLAWAELYLCLSAIFGRFGGRGYRVEGDEGALNLFETSEEDVGIWADQFFPVAKQGTLGVRVKIGF